MWEPGETLSLLGGHVSGCFSRCPDHTPFLTSTPCKTTPPPVPFPRPIHRTMAAPASSDAASLARRPIARSGDDATFPVESLEPGRSKENLQLDLKPAVRPEQMEQEEATPTPPESSSLSSDIETVTVATIEEESLSVLLQEDRLMEPTGEPGTWWGSRVRGEGFRVQSLIHVVQV